MTRLTALFAITSVLSTSAFAAEDDPSTFDPDQKPDAPRVDLPKPAETETYAGVGSDKGYASRGVGEFGGNFAFSVSPDVTTVSADPSIGWFLFDNFELSGILGVRHLTVTGDSSNRFSALVEPSVHVPINDGLFWVGGVGAGVAIADQVGPDGNLDAGFAMAPRTGIQLLIGRSGLLNLGARYSTVFSNIATADNVPLEGNAVLAFNNSLDVQAGYTVMF